VFTKTRLKLYIIVVLLALAACAPADLDITPTVDPAAQTAPIPTETAAEANEPTQATRDLLDELISRVPATLGSTTAVQWNRTDVPPTVVNRPGGITGRITFAERQGGQTEITIGTFNDESSTTTYYESRERDTRLERGTPRDYAPEPNRFGTGTYGSMAIWTRDDVFVQVVILINISTFGDPLRPLVTEIDQIIQEVLEAPQP